MKLVDRTREVAMPSTAMYAKPWSPEHFSPATVSRGGGCAMHGVDVCDRQATVTVIFEVELNAACDEWMREHPEFQLRANDL